MLLKSSPSTVLATATAESSSPLSSSSLLSSSPSSIVSLRNAPVAPSGPRSSVRNSSRSPAVLWFPTAATESWSSSPPVEMIFSRSGHSMSVMLNRRSSRFLLLLLFFFLVVAAAAAAAASAPGGGFLSKKGPPGDRGVVATLGLGGFPCPLPFPFPFPLPDFPGILMCSFSPSFMTLMVLVLDASSLAWRSRSMDCLNCWRFPSRSRATSLSRKPNPKFMDRLLLLFLFWEEILQTKYREESETGSTDREARSLPPSILDTQYSLVWCSRVNSKKRSSFLRSTWKPQVSRGCARFQSLALYPEEATARGGTL
mmetsp:Transcript_19329/g.44812  ORF Transcript_19329/g.44812 Transcript_19329/m.44812 type:complete len:313 (-) Transcript_19329:205-1143(-)